MLPLIIISALGGIIASVACTAITVAIEGYLDSKKVKDMQKKRSFRFSYKMCS